MRHCYPMIATIHLNGETFLAKNRDRKYNPNIEIIHELINGTEVMFIHDTLTDWSEGMNEYGIGIVNASLMVDFDEFEGDIAKGDKDKDKKEKSKEKDKKDKKDKKSEKSELSIKACSLNVCKVSL